MDLSKFKLLHEDENNYHISGPNKQAFKVEKNKLSEQAQATISKMKSMSAEGKYAEGGQVDPQEQKLANEDKPLENTYPEAILGLAAAPVIAPEITAGLLAAGKATSNELAQNPERGSFGSQPNLPANEMGGMARLQEATKMSPGETAALQQANQNMLRHSLSAYQKIGANHPNAPALAQQILKLGGTVPGYNEGGKVENTGNAVFPTQSISKENDESNPKVTNEILKSYQKRSNKSEGSNTREEMLEPSNYAEGGDVMPSPTPEPVMLTSPEINNSSNDVNSVLPDTNNPTNQMPPFPTFAPSQSPQSGVTGSFDNTPPPQALVDNGPTLESASRAEKNANLAGAAAVAGQGKEESNVIKDLMANLPKPTSQGDIIARYKDSDDKLLQAYNDKKIDPNRLLGSTSNKITAGLSMILSGFGAGLTGQPNMAAKSIEDAINRDIDAQKNDQSKSMNLWKMNREKMHSDQEADLASQNQMYTAVKAKLMQAASNFKGPQALAAAQGANALIDSKLAQNHMLMSAISPSSESTGGLSPNTEQGTLNHLNRLQSMAPMNPIIAKAAKEQQDTFIPSAPGRPAYKTSLPVPQALRQELTGYDDLAQLSKQMIAFSQKSGSTGMWSGPNVGEGKALQEQFNAALKPLALQIKRGGGDSLISDLPHLNDANPRETRTAAYRQFQKFIQQRQGTLIGNLGAKPLY